MIVPDQTHQSLPYRNDAIDIVGLLCIHPARAVGSAFGEDKPTIAKNRFANVTTGSRPGEDVGGHMLGAT